jgi:hypothetical protein
MGHILGEVIVWVFIDILWQGIGYATGSVIVPMFSLGRVQTGMWPSEAEKHGIESDDPFFYTKGKRRFMFANIVAASGMIFWLFVIGIIALAFNAST